MADVTLVAETGRTHGSASSRRLRGEGRIPGVVYGRGECHVKPERESRFELDRCDLHQRKTFWGARASAD